MKKISFFLCIMVLCTALSSCYIYYPNEPQETTEETTELKTTEEERVLIYFIELQNVIADQYYPLDVGETFYLYVKPYFLDNGQVLKNDDVSLMSLNDSDALDIKFIAICANGAYLFEITTLKEGNCDLFAIDQSKRMESQRIYLSIRDYKNMNIKYRITTIDNVFHKPHCEIYSKVNLHERVVIDLDRKTLRNKGYTPCEECCG